MRIPTKITAIHLSSGILLFVGGVITSQIKADTLSALGFIIAI